jgi:hypothetical protein
MAGRPEPFHLALISLRERLRDGAYPPGARITATDVADDLRLSATPVREALCRLAGEGLVEDRRGQGFFVRALPAADIADLYRLSLAHLLIALDPHRPQVRRESAPQAMAPEPLAPIPAVERLFSVWLAQAASRSLAMAFHRVQVQLGPVRRAEPLVIDDMDAEAAALLGLEAADSSDRLPALRHFHARRIRLAERLSAVLQRSDPEAQL